jgi:hypothetical protein
LAQTPLAIICFFYFTYHRRFLQVLRVLTQKTLSQQGSFGLLMASAKFSKSAQIASKLQNLHFLIDKDKTI